MLTSIRGKFGAIVVSTIIGMISLVFVIEGVFKKSGTRGMHEGTVAGTVNGDPITLQEFNREYTRRLEFFKNLAGGKINEDQLKAFQIREGVFQELVRRKLLVQEAYKQDLLPSDDEVKEKIRVIPAFQKDGKFDLASYKRVLEANGFTPGGFERMIREDSAAEKWDDYFRKRVRAGDDEVRREFESIGDKRVIKYVMLTAESGRRSVNVAAAEVDAFVADAAKLNIAKNQFEAAKDTEFKGKTFAQAREKIVRDVIAGEKVSEITKHNEKLAEQIAAVLDASKGPKSPGDAKVNALLKGTGVEVKSTPAVARGASALPGIGEAHELMTDAFAKASPIDGARGGKAKVYKSAAGILVAIVTETQRPDPAKLAAEHDTLAEQIVTRKQRELFDSWIKKISAKAKIDPNPSVVSSQGAETG